ncbi:MAG: site-specific DNA-methyltransferase [Patescibacteria group bacterium]|jgi:adenine-specific DNA-methyltransferase
MPKEIAKNNGKDYSQLNKEDLIKIVQKLESRKKYGLIWDEEKVKEQFEKDAEGALPVLKEVKGKEITDKNGGPINILIEGDNYHALSVLNFTHQGKIDFIYIDPPYNRGTNDFKYNDNYVDKEDIFRHSKWLSFMDKRLRLSRNLLKEKGVMFISIDDNEYANLKLLCNEIFGEDKVETYIWCLQDKTEGSFVKTSTNTVRKEHEYILACFKSQIKFKKYKGEKSFSEGSFSNPDNDPKGPWFSGNMSRNGIKSTTGSKYYTIVTPTGKKYARNWTLSKDEYEELLLKGEIFFSKNGDGVPRQKIYQFSDSYFIQSSVFSDVHTSITGKNELKEIFNNETPFDYPKPTDLIKRLIEISTANQKAVALDFFAGSGTTGHAVLELNRQDGGDRKFILCTNNENNICDEVCYPRVKKVITGYKGTKDSNVKGLGGSLKYFKTKFVKNASNKDDFKIRITKECTEMLCLREGIFDEIKKTDDYRIFQQGDKVLAVYYSLDRKALSDLKKELNKIDGEKVFYCFTLDPLGLDKSEFIGWNNVSLEPIPQKILDVYKQIYEY